MADCIRTASPFGVVSVDRAVLSTVGVVTIVKDVTHRYADGRFDVIVEGRERFRIEDVRDDVAPYLVADVIRVEDDLVPVNPMLQSDVAAIFNKISDLVFGAEATHFDPDEAGRRLGSWFMAPKSGLELSQKQELLELRTENERLEYLLRHLNSILPTVQQAEAVQRVIRNDGYFAT